MALPVIWAIIAACLTIVEILTMWIWSICIAAGALLAALASLAGVSLVGQIITLAAGGLLFFLCFGKLIQRMYANRSNRHGENFNSNMDALKGRRALVIQSTSGHQHARVRIDGDNWQVMLQNHEDLHRNDEIEIVGHDSIVLIANLINKGEEAMDPQR